LSFQGSEDLKKISEEVNSGNFVILDIDEWYAQKVLATSPEDGDDDGELESLFSVLDEITKSAGGDFYIAGRGLFALAPAPFRFWKQKPQSSKDKKRASKHGETQFSKCLSVVSALKLRT